MSKLDVTKDFRSFVEAAMIEEYQEVYDFYQAATGNTEGCPGFTVEPCNGSEDILITRTDFNQALRLTPKSAEFLPKWIEEHLMSGLDAESFWGMEHAKEEDDIREQREK